MVKGGAGAGKGEGVTLDGFLVVGVGASAGGLEAFEAFLDAVPDGNGLAFILCPHLDPKHISLLPELLQRRTGMEVGQIREGEAVRPDRVYVLPPDRDLEIREGALRLTERSLTRGAHLPIDGFLRSLARDQGDRAVGVILSGTGSDGALGVREIKAGGGMVLVQDPESARYDGMPRSAIATGLADFVVPPEGMSDELLRYAVAGIRPAAEAADRDGGLADALPRIFVLLKSRTGSDFSHYKPKTLLRRIERRMHVHQLSDINEYVRYLEESEHEAKALFKELLIGVSSFFRDPDAFRALGSRVLTPMLNDRLEGDSVRVWVPGCGTGEEAYSIGILLLELMREKKCLFSVQIFGTDLDAAAVDFARGGLYPASVAGDLGPERLRAWFRKEGAHYRVSQQLRELLVFAPQNVTRDPPFTRLDLISCRNLLIYFDAELQGKLLPTFHYSLNADGVLFLGSSETIGAAADLFETVDREWRIFRRKPGSRGGGRLPQLPEPFRGRIAPAARPGPVDLAAQKLAEAVLEQSGAPPCVIIDAAADIVYVHGRTGRFLEPPAGRASMNVLGMARAGLKSRLSTAIRAARRDRREALVEDVRVQSEGGSVSLDLRVRPLEGCGPQRDLLLISFEEQVSSTPDPDRETRQSSDPKTAMDTEELRRELDYTRESLRTTIEELQTANEELKSTNEELQSTNEELQSTNEEMETSREELQSLNEEASTVNAELQGRIEELSAANDDMRNLLDSTEIATLFLDRELCVRRFTPHLTRLIPLAATDLGRPLRHFAVNLSGVDLVAIATKTLDTLAVQISIAPGPGREWFQLRVLPYRTAANVIDGVVITFQDVTEERRAAMAAEKARLFAESIVDTIREPLMVLDDGLRVVTANPAFCRTFGLQREEAEGRELSALSGGQWDLPPLRRLFGELLENERVIEAYEVAGEIAGLGPRRFLLNARRLAAGDGEPELILLAFEDVTDRGTAP